MINHFTTPDTLTTIISKVQTGWNQHWCTLTKNLFWTILPLNCQIWFSKRTVHPRFKVRWIWNRTSHSTILRQTTQVGNLRRPFFQHCKLVDAAFQPNIWVRYQNINQASQKMKKSKNFLTLSFDLNLKALKIISRIKVHLLTADFWP